MRLMPVCKTLLAACLSSLIVLLASTTGRTASGASPTVTVESVSGYAGHAFVYAQVKQAAAIYPAPTGTMHESPYYADWLPLPLTAPTCSSVWGVYVMDRATNTQVNPPNDPSPRNFGTANKVCVTSSVTPVGQAPVADASARLDLDLSVTVTPTVAHVGSPSSIVARLSSSVTQDLNVDLNMAIEDWQVTRWLLDFGDGQSQSVAGGGTSVEMPHSYQSAGQYDARVTASIFGHAQAAVYDRYGWPQLIQQGFAVEVGNDALAKTEAVSLRRYIAPEAVAAVTPSLYPSMPDPVLGGLRQINVARGRLTLLAVHCLLLREASLTVNGHLQGFAQSQLIAWRLDGGAADGASGPGTIVGTIHPAADLLTLQWDLPDRLQNGQPAAYSVPITLFVRSRFPDGHLVTYSIASSFSVLVNFAAESG